VFVCEHGAAKSVIATAHFNKMAAERGLRARATYRGVNPQAELSADALKGLRDDGLPAPNERSIGDQCRGCRSRDRHLRHRLHPAAPRGRVGQGRQLE
jgi:protein-tyrosine-phosphatase